MTDRELLELAAKAIGGSLVWTGDTCLLFDAEKCTSGAWNPLTDDGDALRLAVKLGISVQHEIERGIIWCNHQVTPNTTDPYAATRRAIVRAAAEIGRSMA